MSLSPRNLAEPGAGSSLMTRFEVRHDPFPCPLHAAVRFHRLRPGAARRPVGHERARLRLGGRGQPALPGRVFRPHRARNRRTHAGRRVGRAAAPGAAECRRHGQGDGVGRGGRLVRGRRVPPHQRSRAEQPRADQRDRPGQAVGSERERHRSTRSFAPGPRSTWAGSFPRSAGRGATTSPPSTRPPARSSPAGTRTPTRP
jgi:hypothetical protein